MYHKFGFCKYKDNCRNHHHQEHCKDLSACKTKKTCFKRHPKVCRNFSLENGCKQDCGYHHPVKTKVNKNSEFNEMVKIMEGIMQQMTIKINNLETELVKLKTGLKRNEELLERKYEKNYPT